MDRYDEKKTDPREVDDVTPAREGDILGLGGAPVPKSPEDPSAARDRAEGIEGGGFEDVERSSGTGAVRRTPGATGIDMGSGGTGTDVAGS